MRRRDRDEPAARGRIGDGSVPSAGRVQRGEEIARQMRRPVSTELAADREARATQTHDRVEPALEPAYPHLELDVHTLSRRIAGRIDQKVLAADSADGRVRKVLDEALQRLGFEEGGRVRH